jgi:uncharacterized protein (DUF488 family)
VVKEIKGLKFSAIMIKTSCFRKAKDLPNAVSIARSDFPWPMKGYRFEKYPALMPSLRLLRDWKEGKVTEKDYIERYCKETLSKLDPEKVFNDLDGKILLCHEAPGAFCHRRLVARWLEHCIGVKVIEL